MSNLEIKDHQMEMAIKLSRLTINEIPFFSHDQSDKVKVSYAGVN